MASPGGCGGPLLDLVALVGLVVMSGLVPLGSRGVLKSDIFLFLGILVFHN